MADTTPARPSQTAGEALAEALGWEWEESLADHVPSVQDVIADALDDLRALGYEIVPVTPPRGSSTCKGPKNSGENSDPPKGD